MKYHTIEQLSELRLSAMRNEYQRQCVKQRLEHGNKSHKSARRNYEIFTVMIYYWNLKKKNKVV